MDRARARCGCGAPALRRPRGTGLRAPRDGGGARGTGGLGATAGALQARAGDRPGRGRGDLRGTRLALVISSWPGSRATRPSTSRSSNRLRLPEYLTRHDAPEGNSDAKISLAIDNQNGIAVSKTSRRPISRATLGFAESLLDGVARQLSADPAPESKRVTAGGLPLRLRVRDQIAARRTSRSIFLFHGRDEDQINCQFSPTSGRRSWRPATRPWTRLEVTGSAAGRRSARQARELRDAAHPANDSSVG